MWNDGCVGEGVCSPCGCRYPSDTNSSTIVKGLVRERCETHLLVMSTANSPAHPGPASQPRPSVSSVHPVVVGQSSTVWILWEAASPLVYKLFAFYFKIFLLLASIAMLVVTTILLYSLLYWLVVPKRLHSYPVHFDYLSGEDSVCSNITLAERQWEGLMRPLTGWDRPTPGFDFDVTLTLEFPSSEYNLAQPPVMFDTSVALKDHTVIAKVRRGFLVPTMSTFARWFRDLATMALTGFHLFNDRLTEDVTLVESLPVFHHESVSFLSLCMSPPLHVYSATLNFVSKLSGFRYIIAHHPILVGIVTVATVVIFAALGVLAAALVRYVRQSHRDDPDDNEEDSCSGVSPREEFMTTAERGGSSLSELGSDTGIRRRMFRD